MNDDLERDALLQQRAQRLPETLQPQRSLWEGIEARIGAPEVSARQSQAVAPTFGWPVAAITLLGVGLALLAMNLPIDQPTAQSSTTEPFVAVQESSQMQVQMHELLDAQLEDLPEDVRNTVVQNLAIIASAREEIRAALADNPDNALLHSLYRNSYANERTLLKDVEAMARQSKRRTQL